MSLAAGRLRHRVNLIGFTQVQNPDTGAMTEGWAAYAANVPAEVAPVSAREFASGQAVQAQVTVRVTVRARADVHAQHRVEHRNRTYNIEGVLPDPESGLEYLTLACSEVLPESGVAP